MRGDQIKATQFHDAGAYARRSYCARYSDNPQSLHGRLLCDCGEIHGWSGSFERPTDASLWSGKEPEPQHSSPKE